MRLVEVATQRMWYTKLFANWLAIIECLHSCTVPVYPSWLVVLPMKLVNTLCNSGSSGTATDNCLSVTFGVYGNTSVFFPFY